MNLAVVLLIVFFVAIAIGFKTNINVGIVSMTFVYLIGSYIMGIKPSELIAMWPLKIFFILVFVSLFYNFATINGTLDKLALNILYKFGRQARLLPFVVFVIGLIMSAMGTGPYGVIVLLCPILFAVCDKIKMSKLMLAVAAYLGAVAGGSFPTCSTGAVINGIIAEAGYQEQALRYSFIICVSAIGIFFLLNTLLYFFVFKGYQVSLADVSLEKPEPYNPKQKKSLLLIVLFVVALLLPYVLATVFDNAFVTAIVKYNDVAFIALVFAGISSLLKLAEEKKAFAAVPWNTVIMIGGVSMMVGLAVRAGTIDLLVSAVSSIDNPAFTPALMSAIASGMSLFSSTTGVVIPTLYPMIAEISASTGVSAPLLMVVINNGSGIVGMSPLSACGALIMGCVADKELDFIYKRLFLIAGGSMLYAFVTAILIGMFV